MTPSLRRGSAFVGPAAPQRPRRRSTHDLCEGCGHFRSEHRSGKTCHRDGCPCQEMGWTPLPVRVGNRTTVTDEIKLQMEELLKSGMNYRKVAATIGCSIATVRNYFPGYGDNGRADVEASRALFKQRQNRIIQRHMTRKGRTS